MKETSRHGRKENWLGETCLECVDFRQCLRMRRRVHAESWGKGEHGHWRRPGGLEPRGKGGSGDALRVGSRGSAEDLDFTERTMGEMSWDYVLGGPLCRGKNGGWG